MGDWEEGRNAAGGKKVCTVPQAPHTVHWRHEGAQLALAPLRVQLAAVCRVVRRRVKQPRISARLVSSRMRAAAGTLMSSFISDGEGEHRIHSLSVTTRFHTQAPPRPNHHPSDCPHDARNSDNDGLAYSATTA